MFFFFGRDIHVHVHVHAGAVALSNAFYGEGTGPIFLDDTDCDPSNHTNLLECFVGGTIIGRHNCLHSEDVSVICPGEHH